MISEVDKLLNQKGWKDFLKEYGIYIGGGSFLLILIFIALFRKQKYG